MTRTAFEDTQPSSEVLVGRYQLYSEILFDNEDGDEAAEINWERFEAWPAEEHNSAYDLVGSTEFSLAPYTINLPLRERLRIAGWWEPDSPEGHRLIAAERSAQRLALDAPDGLVGSGRFAASVLRAQETTLTLTRDGRVLYQGKTGAWGVRDGQLYVDVPDKSVFAVVVDYIGESDSERPGLRLYTSRYGITCFCFSHSASPVRFVMTAAPAGAWEIRSLYDLLSASGDPQAASVTALDLSGVAPGRTPETTTDQLKACLAVLLHHPWPALQRVRLPEWAEAAELQSVRRLTETMRAGLELVR